MIYDWANDERVSSNFIFRKEEKQNHEPEFDRSNIIH